MDGMKGYIGGGVVSLRATLRKTKRSKGETAARRASCSDMLHQVLDGRTGSGE
jgi:hypothetical protein